MFSTLYITYLSFQMNFKMLFAICFNFDQSEILQSGYGLTLSQTANLRLFETDGVCRGEFLIWWKWQKVLLMGRKHCGKGEIACYEQFLLFLQCFQKAFTADS